MVAEPVSVNLIYKRFEGWEAYVFAHFRPLALIEA